MIITLFICLVAIFWIALMFMKSNAGELIICPIMGLMFGTLYDKETNGNTSYHTAQIVLFVVAFTFTWETYE
jgi:hypothetical protein